MATLTWAHIHPHAGKASTGLGAGAVAGLFGGAVLAVYMAGMNLLQGKDLWIGAKMAGFPFLGQQALDPGFMLAPVLIGLVCHFAVSAAWGAPFGFLASGMTRAGTMVFGLVWGIAVWLGMFYVVLPFVGAAEIARMMPIGAAVFEHLLFGLAVAIGFIKCSA